jgi:nucleoside-diphosphate kinase
MEHTYAMIKPGYERVWGKIFDRISDEGFTVLRMKTMKWDPDFISRFYVEHIGKEFYERMSEYLTSGLIVAFELARVDAIKHWRSVIGPTVLEEARNQAPNSLRALYSRTTTENLVHGSDSPEAAIRELRLVFENG